MKKKLIEVALPLEAINKESAREKSIRHGHPSTLHLWWARRPLAACRAVLFASLVDDPSSLPEQFPTEADQDKERQRLFRLIEELVKWDNSSNQTILKAAHDEILKSTDGHPPPIYDPFCGGGSIPLEAQRLGLEAHGSDLNPVAVLITKALIEIPPKFAGQPPVNPAAKKKMTGKGMWTGARGLADDVRYYGQWMRDRAEQRIGHLYPKAKLPQNGGNADATVIAWLWARTVKCPNPACGARMPLVRSFALGTKPGKKAWIQPVADPSAKTVRFEVQSGNGSVPEGTVTRRGARCLVCDSTTPLDYVRAEGRGHRMDAQMMAIAADGVRGRNYVPVSPEHEEVAAAAVPQYAPDTELPEKALGFRVQAYGFTKHRDLFTPRQLVALTTISDLVTEACEQAIDDGATVDRAEALATYLSFFVSRLADLNNAFCQWRSDPAKEHVGHLFSRQAISMVWDFAEANPLGNSAGGWDKTLIFILKFLEMHPVNTSGASGDACQLDATQLPVTRTRFLISTDPPYYDNIGYADLSDFFYVWLRRCLSKIYPQLFSTILVPKKQELVAAPERFDGDRAKAQQFFEEGSVRAFGSMRAAQHKDYPLTVYYAFKQAETDEDQESSNTSAIASTGWETMLEGLMKADFQITGTWPSRSELGNRMRGQKSNALASSIVLACRPRQESAVITTRKDFLSSLKRELPLALRNLQKGNIAPVDLAQAAIGPGMAVFSRYKKVLETDGSPMRVRTALSLINQGLDEVLSELESEFDPDTRWALSWFEQHQFDEGLYGEAEVLATAKALSISHLAEAGILNSRAGKVRLLRREELPEDWDPSAVDRFTVWEVTQHLIRSLDQKGEKETANLKAKIGGMAEIARDLAYRLYTLCERKGWAEEAGYYNSLVVAWPSMASEVFELK
jgi:putative DNA methylase